MDPDGGQYLVVTWPQLLFALGVLVVAGYAFIRRVESKEVLHHMRFQVDEESAEQAGRVIKALEERIQALLRNADRFNAKVRPHIP